MKKILSTLLTAALMVSLAACGGNNGGNVPAEAPADTAEGGESPSGAGADNAGAAKAQSTQILFNGSSTLAPVITAIALEFNETYSTWENVDSSFPSDNIAIYVSSGGSGQGAKARAEGTTDFGMIARDVSDSDRDNIPDLREYLVGIDALTLAVHPNNPIVGITDDLSTEDIVKLFSGEYATWQDLDGSLPAEEVIVVTRDIGGGAHEVFQNKVMGDVEVKADAIQAPSMGALVTRIMENEYAIGYASFGVANQNADSIVMLKVDGVEPTVANIQSGAYIVQRPLVLLGSGEPTAIQQSFLDVVLGDEGQATVEEMGFIPAA